MRPDADNRRIPDRSLTATELRELANDIMRVSRIWACAMIALAVAAAVTVTHPNGGSTSVTFDVGFVSVTAVALIWLPAVLRLLTITGGSLKAGGVEASATGLLGSSDDLVAGLSTIRAQTEALEQPQNRARAPEILGQVRVEVDRLAAQHLAEDPTVNDYVFHELGRRYEALRRELPPGNERTTAMTRIVNEARVRANAAPDRANALALRLMRSPLEGDRIVGLGAVQEAPSPEAFPLALQLFTHSSTAFEAFQALLALQRIVPNANEELALASSAIQAEKLDPRGVGIMNDPFLPTLMDQTLEVLQRRA